MENDAPKKSVEFTRKEYLALLKIAYLGNWVANAHRDGGPLDPLMDEYEEICDRVFSQAPLFGLEKYTHHEDHGEHEHHYPTRLFEEGTDVRGILDAHDDAIFWDEIAERLGERDFHGRHPEAEIAAMSEDEYMRRHHESIETYEDEFSDHGLDRLEIVPRAEAHEKSYEVQPRKPKKRKDEGEKAAH